MEVGEHLDEAHRLMGYVEKNNGPDHRDYGRYMMEKARVHLDMAAIHNLLEEDEEDETP